MDFIKIIYLTSKINSKYIAYKKGKIFKQGPLPNIQVLGAKSTVKTLFSHHQSERGNRLRPLESQHVLVIVGFLASLEGVAIDEAVRQSANLHHVSR